MLSDICFDLRDDLINVKRLSQSLTDDEFKEFISDLNRYSKKPYDYPEEILLKLKEVVTLFKYKNLAFDKFINILQSVQIYYDNPNELRTIEDLINTFVL